jgi:ABC-type antimicrobial peptide transport system permease subunit
VRLANGPALQVVGIVKDGKYSDITEPQQPAVFIPLAQKNLPSLAANMIVLGSGDVTTLAAPIRAVVHDLDAAMPVFNVRPLEAVYQSRAILPQRLIAQIMLALGALSLVLATVGLYGVVAYLTALRTHEISIRMALGASRRRVLVMVLNQGSKMVGVGLVAGLALALALTPAFAAAFNFAPRDGAVLALVALTLMTAAFMASVIPAQRAARINPSAALREE